MSSSTQPWSPETLHALDSAELSVTGRIVGASNATLLCRLEIPGLEEQEQPQCIYKPVQGERPLWDFPDGTLAERELAAFLVSTMGGWDLIPPTTLREGPFGLGMVQLWVPTEEDGAAVDVVRPRDTPAGWHTVLRAVDEQGEPALLVHSDESALRALAALDVILNNADRKAGHVLRCGEDGRMYGIDHGVCLNEEDKLRTVLWGWAGVSLAEPELALVRATSTALEGGLGDAVSELITIKEQEALWLRTQLLLEEGRFPQPHGSWPAIPWPVW